MYGLFRRKNGAHGLFNSRRKDDEILGDCESKVREHFYDEKMKDWGKQHPEGRAKKEEGKGRKR